MSDGSRARSTYYDGSEYHTPGDRKRGLFSRLVPGRLPLVYHLIRITVRGRSKAVRGQFTDQAFVDRSDEVLAAIESCGGRVHVTGLDHLRSASPPIVIVANHMSLLETFMLPAMIVPVMPVSFIVKESLVTHPVFGPVMRSQDPITVGRRNPREDLKQVLSEGVKRLERGTSVCVFPQSTRLSGFRTSAFNSIGVKLAQRGGASVLPVALKTDFLGIGRWVKDFGPVDPSKELRLHFGELIDFGERSPKEVHGEVLEFLVKTLGEWGVICGD